MAEHVALLFVEQEPREWYYLLRKEGEAKAQERIGPFASLEEAEDHQLEHVHEMVRNCHIVPYRE